MRTEPDLKQSRLLETLRARYLLDVVRLTFVPFGLDSWSYVATCRDGRRAFVKLSRRIPAVECDSSGAPAAGRTSSPQGPRSLSAGGPRRRLPEYGRWLRGPSPRVPGWPQPRRRDRPARRPIRSGGRHGGRGPCQHQRCPSSRRTRRAVRASSLRPFAETLAGIEVAAVNQVRDYPTLATLRQMVLPRARALRVAIGGLEDLRDLARTRDSDWVLCHTDIWGSTLLCSDDGRLHLLDWNGALLGPPEHDLFMFAGTDFFPADRFGWFLDRYEAAFRRVRLDAETFGFYFFPAAISRTSPPSSGRSPKAVRRRWVRTRPFGSYRTSSPRCRGSRPPDHRCTPCPRQGHRAIRVIPAAMLLAPITPPDRVTFTSRLRSTGAGRGPSMRGIGHDRRRPVTAKKRPAPRCPLRRGQLDRPGSSSWRRSAPGSR